jgi:hypothetical protein
LETYFIFPKTEKNGAADALVRRAGDVKRMVATLATNSGADGDVKPSAKMAHGFMGAPGPV